MKQPEIRFNGFSDEWAEEKMGTLIKKGGSGGTPSSSKAEYYDGNIPFLSIADLSKSNVYVDETSKSITDLGLNNSAAWIVPKNAISLAMYASVGKVGILSKPMATSQAFYNMVFDSIETGLFVYQWLTNRYITNGWRKDISTGTQPNLNAQIVKSTVIQLPTLPEQQKIGALFSKYDAIIALREQKLAELNALKKGMLQQMFDDGSATSHKPQVRFSGFNDVWVEKKLGDLLSTHSYRSFLSESYQEGAYSVIQQGSKPVSGYADGNPFTDFEQVVLFGDHTLSLYKPNSPFFVASDGIKILSADGFDGNYLFDILEKHMPLSQGYKRHYSILKNQCVCFTKNELEQQKIGQLFKHLDARISNEQSKIEQLKAQKQGLLQRML